MVGWLLFFLDSLALHKVLDGALFQLACCFFFPSFFTVLFDYADACRASQSAFFFLQVYRNRKWRPISSDEIIPGDIVSIGNGLHDGCNQILV